MPELLPEFEVPLEPVPDPPLEPDEEPDPLEGPFPLEVVDPALGSPADEPGDDVEASGWMLGVAFACAAEEEPPQPSWNNAALNTKRMAKEQAFILINS